MNLLKQMQYEIKDLGLIDSYEIAYYLYIRTGEIFCYDSLYLFGTNEEKRVLDKKRHNIQNITDFKVTCSSWTYLFVDLLNAFHIFAKPFDNGYHSYVLFYIGEQEFVADITTGNKDMNGIKFGKEIEHFHLNSGQDIINDEQRNKKLNEKLRYKKGISHEDVILKIIEEIKRKSNNFEEYLYNVYKSLEVILNAHINKDFSSGTMFIHQFLKQCIDENYPVNCARLFDTEEGIYIEVYSICVNETIHYFTYQKENDTNYEFHEITYNNLQELKRNYFSEKLSRLTLDKKLERYKNSYKMN